MLRPFSSSNQLAVPSVLGASLTSFSEKVSVSTFVTRSIYISLSISQSGTRILCSTGVTLSMKPRQRAMHPMFNCSPSPIPMTRTRTSFNYDSMELTLRETRRTNCLIAGKARRSQRRRRSNILRVSYVPLPLALRYYSSPPYTILLGNT